MSIALTRRIKQLERKAEQMQARIDELEHKLEVRPRRGRPPKSLEVRPDEPVNNFEAIAAE